MNLRYNRGLIIGKFLPFHQGHEYLMKTGIEKCAKLTILVCQTTSYEIDVAIRANWIQERFPNVCVRVLVHDERLDSVSTSISKEWAEITKDFLGYSPDVIFSSEDYGIEYAKFLKADHVMVDRERLSFPVSGTKVRESLFDNWNFLTQRVKDYYPRKIIVLGAESTGTTTLSMDLARHYDTTWVPEYGRCYFEGRMFLESEDWSDSEFIHIMEQQNRMEDALVKRANRFLICDTDSFATKIWHFRYTNRASEEVSRHVRFTSDALYLVTPPNIPFVQDGTRDGEHLRNWMHDMFLYELDAHGLDYFTIDESDREERVQFAVSKIEGIPS